MESEQNPNLNNYNQQSSDPSHWQDPLMNSFDWTNEFFDQATTLNNTVNTNVIDINNNSSNNDGANNTNLDKKKISDALTYGPRFCQIYEKFNKDLHLNIDPSRHLMALCTDYLASFIKWARDSNQQIEWISTLLLDNDYLRPEVRNGVVMVLIYTFASIKATMVDKSDMFLTLQDNDQGLGIANKFSLKIYNDPFNYLFFLKTSISALIDAGVIPDNERQNQPRKSKLQYTNQEETDSFVKIQKMLLEQLDSGNVPAAKKIVNHISNFWQIRGKFLRNRRFSSALQSLSQPLSTNSDLSTLLPPLLESTHNIPILTSSTLSTLANEPIETSNSTQRTLKRANSDPFSVCSKKSHIQEASDEDSMLENEDDSSPENSAPSQSIRSLLLSPSTHNLSFFQPHLTIPIPVLRFEKIGFQKWQIIETRVFKIDSFLLQLEPYVTKKMLKVHLIQASGIEPELQTKLMTVSTHNHSFMLGHMGLEAELIKRDSQSIITTWNYAEISQLEGLLHAWESYNQINQQSPKLILQFWKDNYETNQNKHKCIDITHGYLIYESILQLNLLIRKNDRLGIEEDLWASLYPEELFSNGYDMNNSTSESTFWRFLLNYFPQLIVLESKLHEMKTSLSSSDRFSLVTVKYYHSHKLSIDEFSLSTMDSTPSTTTTCYQTLGTLSSSASKMLSRLPQGPFTYVFVLEVIGTKI